MRYIEGPMGSGKTKHLVTEAHQLVQHVRSSSILVLCSNYARKEAFNQRFLAQAPTAQEQLPVYTYAGLVRTTLFNFWPLVEADISKVLPTDSCTLIPELTGMEDSELILKKILAQVKQQSPTAFSAFPGTEAGLIKQLIRRLRLRSENRLSRQEMTERSALLEEMCLQETADIEKRFDRACYLLRTLDNNKQLDVFHKLLETNPIIQAHFKTQVRHLLVDDVDETIPAEQQFIEFLAPTLDTLILTADLDGGSRRGYLNAYPYDWEALKQLRPGETIPLTRSDSIYSDAQTLLNNWKQEAHFNPLSSHLFLADAPLTRVEMMDQVADDLSQLLSNDYEPGDITLVIPKTDPLTLFSLKQQLGKRGIPLQILSGTQRPIDQSMCRAFIYLLQLTNSQAWEYHPSPIEFKSILQSLLKLDQLDPQGLEGLVQEFGRLTIQGQSIPHPALLPLPLKPGAAERYSQLHEWLTQGVSLPFEKQIYAAFHQIVAPYASDKEPATELHRLIDSYTRQKAIYENLPQIERQTLSEPTSCFEKIWITQVKTGTIADSPNNPVEIDTNAVVVATPQKIIDAEVTRKIQCWLDIGSREWSRTDNAPLYNAWVHSAVWDGSTTAFTEEFKEAIIRTRAAHITRTLMLLATEQVRAYASEWDDEGFPQDGLLKPRLLSEAVVLKPTETIERAILRPDQAPILQYQKGTLAISAVPGAGKTFINVELILNLIDRGTEPDQILVLTYMDSAAKTLQGRLKNKLKGITNKLPIISTIHSLAFRILTENDHALSLGFLPEDIEILDEYQRTELLNQVANATYPETVKEMDWARAIERGISHAKSYGLYPSQFDIKDNSRLMHFMPAYILYQQKLKENGQLDFTDLILKAIQILEDFPEVRAHYQQQFRYIIEDEAQDSSQLLQRFITLLGGTHPNLIRTGDTNQSITTTFSSSDTSVFRDFIQNATQVVQMTHSSRCAPEVIELANRWLEQGSHIPTIQNAFQPVQMQPVQEQNPALLFPIQFQSFEMDQEEDQWIETTIRQMRDTYPDCSIAVLARSNEEVTQITHHLHQANIPALSHSDTLNLHPVFSTLLAFLKLLASPGTLEHQVSLYQAMVEANLTTLEQERLEFLQNTSLLFQSPTSINDEFCLQLYYDCLDFSRDSATNNLCELLIRITNRLFHSVEDRCNGYLCALEAQEILGKHPALESVSPLEVVILQFEQFQRSRRGKKGFPNLLLSQKANHFVQVMSLHKSKGQEFDIVFMPHLTEQKFPSQPETVRNQQITDKLMQAINQVIHQAQTSDSSFEQTKKLAQIEEEARLIYVGLTRAKRGLLLSTHRQYYDRFRKLKNTQPALAFSILSPPIEPPQAPSQETTYA